MVRQRIVAVSDVTDVVAHRVFCKSHVIRHAEDRPINAIQMHVVAIRGVAVIGANETSSTRATFVEVRHSSGEEFKMRPIALVKALHRGSRAVDDHEKESRRVVFSSVWILVF